MPGPRYSSINSVLRAAKAASKPPTIRVAPSRPRPAASRSHSTTPRVTRGTPRASSGQLAGIDTKALTRPARSITKTAKRSKNLQRRNENITAAANRVLKARRSGNPDLNKDRRISATEGVGLVRSVGGSKEEALGLSTKLSGESGGNPKAIGDDAAAGYGNTTGLGLWQITTGVGNDETIARHGGRKAMLKPRPNAKAALDIYRSQGLDAWYADSTAPGKLIPPTRASKGKPKKKDLATLRKAGISPKALTPGAKNGAAGKPIQRKGAWAGAKSIADKAAKGYEAVSRKRTPEHNASVGGATNSDHLTTNTRSYAIDLPAGDDVAGKVASRLKLQGWSPGTYERFSIPGMPGYSAQLLWQVEGHYDHNHLGIRWEGRRLPPGTIEGGYGSPAAVGGGSSSGSSGSGGVSSGGGGAGGQGSASSRKQKKARKYQEQTPVEGPTPIDVEASLKPLVAALKKRPAPSRKVDLG